VSHNSREWLSSQGPSSTIRWRPKLLTTFRFKLETQESPSSSELQDHQSCKTTFSSLNISEINIQTKLRESCKRSTSTSSRGSRDRSRTEQTKGKSRGQPARDSTRSKISAISKRVEDNTTLSSQKSPSRSHSGMTTDSFLRCKATLTRL